MSSFKELRKEYERLTKEIEELKQILNDQRYKIVELNVEKRESKAQLTLTKRELKKEVNRKKARDEQLIESLKEKQLKLTVEVENYIERRSTILSDTEKYKQTRKTKRVVLSGVKKIIKDAIKEQNKQERQAFVAMKKMFKTPKVRVPKSKKTYGLNLSNIVKQTVAEQVVCQPIIIPFNDYSYDMSRVNINDYIRTEPKKTYGLNLSKIIKEQVTVQKPKYKKQVAVQRPNYHKQDQPDTPEWKRIQNLKLRQIRYQDGLETSDSETESTKGSESEVVNENPITYTITESAKLFNVPFNDYSYDMSKVNIDEYLCSDIPELEYAPNAITEESSTTGSHEVVEQPKPVIKKITPQDYEQFMSMYKQMNYFQHLPTWQQFCTGIDGNGLTMYSFNNIMNDVEKYCKVPNKDRKIYFRQLQELETLRFDTDRTPYLICLRELFELEPDTRQQLSYEKFLKEIQKLECYDPKYIPCKKMFLTCEYQIPYLWRQMYDSYVQGRNIIDTYISNRNEEYQNAIDRLTNENFIRLTRFFARTDIPETQKESAIVNLIVNEDHKHPDVKKMLYSWE